MWTRSHAKCNYLDRVVTKLVFKASDIFSYITISMYIARPRFLQGERDALQSIFVRRYKDNIKFDVLYFFTI